MSLTNKTIKAQQQTVLDQLRFTLTKQETIFLTDWKPTEKQDFIQNNLQVLLAPDQTYAVHPISLPNRTFFTDTAQTVQELLMSCFTELWQIQADIALLEETIALEEDGYFSEAFFQQGRLQDTFALLGGHEIEATIQQVVQGLAIQPFLQLNVTQLTLAQQQKGLLAKSLLNQVDFLILDNPTTILTTSEQDWLRHFLNGKNSKMICFTN